MTGVGGNYIESFLVNYLKNLIFIKKLAPNTIRAYSIDLGQVFDLKSRFILDTLAIDHEILAINLKMPLLDCTAEENLRLVLNSGLRKFGDLSPATRNRKIAVIKGFLAYLHRGGVTSRDLSLQLSCPKVAKKIPHFLSLDEVLSILSQLKRDPTERNGIKMALFLLLYGGGLRVGEACGLRWADFSSDFIEIRLLGKGNKQRQVSLPKVVGAFFRKMKLTNCIGEFVLAANRFSERDAYSLVREMGKQAGLSRPLNPHALRHSCATHLLSNGANIRVLQQLLGHESLVATEKYLHLSLDHLATTVENLHPLSSAPSARRV